MKIKLLKKMIMEAVDTGIAKITVNDGNNTDVWYLAKGDDSTHFEMVNNQKYLGKFGADKHIGQFRNAPWYDDVRSWLKGGKSPDGKTY